MSGLRGSARQSAVSTAVSASSGGLVVRNVAAQRAELFEVQESRQICEIDAGWRKRGTVRAVLAALDLRWQEQPVTRLTSRFVLDLSDAEALRLEQALVRVGVVIL